MKKRVLFSFLLLFFSFCLSAKDTGVIVDSQWKYKLGNNSLWTEPDYNDSSWKSTKMPFVIPLEGEHYIYLRTTVEVPHQFDGRPVYLDAGHAYAAFDIYLNGSLIGSNGRLPPNENVRPKENTVLLLPEALMDRNQIQLTYVCWTTTDVLEFLERPVFMNAEQSVRIVWWRELLSNTMYVIIAVLCLGMGIYMITQYFLNRKKGTTFLWFALSSITISFYFYDMGCAQTFLPFILQRETARALLPVSMGFLLMFFHQFMDGMLKKRTIIYVIAVDIVSVIGHFALMSKWTLVSTFFTITLAPVMYVCIYGIVVSIKGLHKKNKNMSIVLIGFLCAVGLAFSDILAQVQGKNPFVWLQGYAFFILNLAVFLTLSVDSVKIRKQLTAW